MTPASETGRPTSTIEHDDGILAAMWAQVGFGRGLSRIQMAHVFQMGRKLQRSRDKAQVRCKNCTADIWWMGTYQGWIHADSWMHVCDTSTHEPVAEPHPRFIENSVLSRGPNPGDAS